MGLEFSVISVNKLMVYKYDNKMSDAAQNMVRILIEIFIKQNVTVFI